MALLTSTDYPSVRAAVDVALDATLWPDAKLELDVYKTAVEEEVVERAGKAEADMTAAELAHAKRAARYLLGAMIAEATTALPYFGSDGSLQYVKVNWADRAARLRGQAQEEVDEITSPGSEDEARMPTFFTLARGGRGR